MTKITVLPLILLLLAAPFSATAEDGERRVAVEGIGRVSAEPDMAVVRIAVVREAVLSGVAMDAASKAMTEVHSLIAASGISAEDVQTSQISLSPRWRYSQDGAPPRVTGYVASNALNITVRDLENLGVLLDAVVSEGANSMDGLSFDLSNREQFEDRARVLAVENATHKAAILAGAAGEELGRVISISEGADAAVPVREMAMARDSTPVPVAAGQIEITVAVRAVYSLGE